MKKKSILKVLLLTLLACCLAFALVACGGTKYTVTYDYNDGGATQSTTIEVDEGSLLEEPTAPTRDGYTFDGWFNGDAEWTFATDTVTGDITLTAHWTQNVTPPPAHTHTYGDYTLTTAPTESAAGVATATCSGCEEGTEGHTTTMTLPMLTAENVAEEATDGKYTVATTPATCTAAGSSVYTYHYDGDKTLVAATVSIPMAAHTYGTEIAEVPATCETAGTAAHYECSVCHKLFTKAGDTYTEVTAEDLAINALGHTYGDLIAEDPATCTEDGMEAHYFCDVCDTYFDSEKNPTTEADLAIAAPGHTYGDYTATTAPTAEAAGVATATCSGCEEGTEGHTTTMALPMLTAENIASSATDGKYTVATTEATCTAAGSSVYTYHYDGDKTLVAATVTLDKLEHTWGEWTVETLPALDGSTEGAAVRTCTRANCGAEDELTLPKIAFGSSGSPTNYAVGTFEDPTCQKEGYGILTYTVPEAQGGGTIELRYTLDKVPHSYGTPVYQDSKLTASCTYDCGTTVTATLTFAGGEGATGAAPTKLRVEFDGTSFTVTLPECTFERSGYAFTGWSNGGQTLSGTITLKADDNVTLTATWEPTSEVGTAEDFLAALQNAEVPNITLTADITVNQAVVIDRDVTINLGGHNLTIATAQDATALSDFTIGTITEDENGIISADKAVSVIIHNGNLIIQSPLSHSHLVENGEGKQVTVWDWDGTISGICVQYKSALSLEDVTVESSITGIFLAGGTLNMEGGAINADGVYALGTNATVKVGVSIYAPAYATINNATLTAAGDWREGGENDGAAAMFNVEGTFVLNNVTLTGERQGIIIRGAAVVTINGGSVTSNGTYTDNDSRLTGNWGSGTEVPMAAIAIGDRGNNSSYAGESKLTLLGGVKVVANGAAKEIYAYADTNTTATIKCACTYEAQIEGAEVEGVTVNFGHAYGEWVIATKPSESAEGKATITCSVCAEGTEGHTQSVTLPELTAENVAEEATDGKYTVVDTPATCEAAGSTVYTYHFMFDGELMSLELPAIEHEQLEHVWNVTYADTTLTASCQNGCGDSHTATLTLTGTGATVALGEAATFTVADGFAIDLSKLSVTKEEADVIRAYIANGSIVTGTQTVAANGTLALEVVVEDTSFTVGTDGSQDSGAWSAGAWYVPEWTSVIQKGEVVKVEGALKSQATENHYGAKPLLYSTDNVLGAFRPDNWVTGYDDVNNQYGTAEGFVISKQSIVLYDGATGDDNTNDFFQAVLTDCYYVVMYDWSSDESIKITINLVGNANGAKQIETSEYTIIAAENASLKDWYRIGLSYECCYYNVSSVLRCNGVHDELYCDICNGLNTEQIEALATTSQDFVNNDPDSNWWGGGQTSAVTLSGDYVFKLTFKAPEGRITPDSVFEFATNLGSSNENFIDLNLNGITATDFWGNGTDGWANIATKEIVQEGTRPANGGWAGDYTVYAVRLNNQLIVRAEFTATGSETLTYAITWTMDVAGSMAEGDTTFQIVGNPYGLTDFTMMTGTIPAQS